MTPCYPHRHAAHSAFAFVFLAFNVQLASAQISSGGPWDITRSVSGNAGETVTAGGTDAVQPIGGRGARLEHHDRRDRPAFSPATSRASPPAAEIIEQLLSAGGVQAAGMTGVLATNNTINVQFYVDVDTNTLFKPGALT